jgi:hypothetical protein
MRSCAVFIRDHRPGEFLNKSVFSGMESPEIQLTLGRSRTFWAAPISTSLSLVDTGAIRILHPFAPANRRQVAFIADEDGG